jgi:hypothetical protein
VIRVLPPWTSTPEVAGDMPLGKERIRETVTVADLLES